MLKNDENLQYVIVNIQCTLCIKITIRCGLLGRLTGFKDRLRTVLESLEAGCVTLHAFVHGFADRFVNALDGGADFCFDGSNYGQLKVLVDGTASALAAAVCQSTVKLCCSLSCSLSSVLSMSLSSLS